MRRTLLALLLTAVALPALAQNAPADAGQYPFIKYQANHLHFDSASASMQRFFAKWDTMVSTGQGQLNIVHIGSSHVQAGTLPNAIRFNLLSVHPDLVGGRGMIFPYSAAAKCNNPPDYKVHCVQKTQLTRNVYKEPDCELGVSGIAITVADERAEVQIVMNDSRVDYATRNVVIIGHSDDGIVPRLRVEGADNYPSFIDTRTDRYFFNLRHATDSFTVVLPCRTGQRFTLRGLVLGNRRPGLSYHSIGVNGASVPDYLKCHHFTRDLQLLHPDAVVFGIGINDAVPTNFDTAAFRRNYLQLVDSVRSVNPDCAIIFVTNNDSYRRTARRRYAVNTNGPLAREVFYRLAREVGGAVWDQFEVMGGLRSMEKWQRAHLAQPDHVHFTHEGYRVVGSLFANALLEAFEANRKTTNTSTPDDERYRYISD